MAGCIDGEPEERRVVFPGVIGDGLFFVIYRDAAGTALVA